MAELGISRTALDGLTSQEASYRYCRRAMNFLSVMTLPSSKSRSLKATPSADVVADAGDATGAAIDGARPAGRGNSSPDGGWRFCSKFLSLW